MTCHCTYLYLILLMVGLVATSTGCSRHTAAQLMEAGSNHGNGAECIPFYTKAIRKDPTCVEAYWRRADAYARTRQYPPALQAAAILNQWSHPVFVSGSPIQARSYHGSTIRMDVSALKIPTNMS